ncbi:MAG: hypothetical protein AAFQ57_14330, partial [Cyanobacteria bacterium J06626_14]
LLLRCLWFRYDDGSLAELFQSVLITFYRDLTRHGEYAVEEQITFVGAHNWHQWSAQQLSYYKRVV